MLARSADSKSAGGKLLTGTSKICQCLYKTVFRTGVVTICRYENTERRAASVAEKGIKYIGMGVSGGEEGARNGAQLLRSIHGHFIEKKHSLTAAS